jgi:hypothetical protein
MSSLPSSSVGTYREERDKLASEAAKNYWQQPDSEHAVYILTCFDFFDPLHGKFDKKSCYVEWRDYFRRNKAYAPNSVKGPSYDIARMYKVGRTDEGMKRYFGKYPSVSKHPPGKDLWLFETYVSFNIPAGGDAQMEVESMFNRWFRGEAPIKGTPGNLNAQMQRKGLTVFPIRDYHRCAVCRQKKLGTENGENDLNMECVNYLNSSTAPCLGMLLPFDGTMVDGKYVQTSYQKPSGQGGIELVFNCRLDIIRRTVYGATLWWLINQIEWENTKQWPQTFVYRYPAWGMEKRADTIKLGGVVDWKRVREAVFNFKKEAPKTNLSTVEMWVRLKTAMFNEWQKGNWEELFNLMSNFGIKLYNYPDFTRGALDAANEDMVAVAEKSIHVPRIQALEYFHAQIEEVKLATHALMKSEQTSDTVDAEDVASVTDYKTEWEHERGSMRRAYRFKCQQMEKALGTKDEEIERLEKDKQKLEAEITSKNVDQGRKSPKNSELKNKELLRF